MTPIHNINDMFAPHYLEEEAGDFTHWPKLTKLFPLSQYKFKDPCSGDKCLVSMICTTPCEDKHKYHKWLMYRQRKRRWFSSLDVSIYVWSGMCFGSIIAIILGFLTLIFNNQQ